MRGDRAVVDDAAAPRRLAFHPPESFLHAQEHAGQVDVDDVLPLFERQILERNSRRVYARIVEQHIDAAECLHCFAEQCANRCRIGNVCWNDERVALGGFGSRLLQRLAPSSGERNAIAMLQ